MLQNLHVLLTFDKVHNPLRLPCETTSKRPKVLRTREFYILTWKCASRHNGVQFSSLIWLDGSAPAALASQVFDPPEPQIYLFPHLRLLSLTLPLLWSSLFFSSLLWLFPPLLFHLSIFFGSLTSKLPSIIYCNFYFDYLFDYYYMCMRNSNKL